MSDYLQGLASQENAPITKLKEGQLIFPNKPPEDAKRGERDIGFGHKITGDEDRLRMIYGIPFEEGITLRQAYDILGADISIHMNRAARKWGDTFYNLPQTAKDILTDYSFTGTLHKFPSFFRALRERDWEGSIKHFERSYTSGGQRVLLTRRNRFILDKLLELKEKGFFK